VRSSSLSPRRRSEILASLSPEGARIGSRRRMLTHTITASSNNGRQALAAGIFFSKLNQPSAGEPADLETSTGV
jgi:hypothetical protein